MLQPIERVNGVWVAFGLGNFLSNMRESEWFPAASQDGAVVDFTVTFVDNASKPNGAEAVVGRPHVTPTWIYRDNGWVIRDVLAQLADPTIPGDRPIGLSESLARTTDVLGEFIPRSPPACCSRPSPSRSNSAVGTPTTVPQAIQHFGSAGDSQLRNPEGPQGGGGQPTAPRRRRRALGSSPPRLRALDAHRVDNDALLSRQEDYVTLFEHGRSHSDKLARRDAAPGIDAGEREIQRRSGVLRPAPNPLTEAPRANRSITAAARANTLVQANTRVQRSALSPEIEPDRSTRVGRSVATGPRETPSTLGRIRRSALSPEIEPDRSTQVGRSVTTGPRQAPSTLGRIQRSVDSAIVIQRYEVADGAQERNVSGASVPADTMRALQRQMIQYLDDLRGLEPATRGLKIAGLVSALAQGVAIVAEVISWWAEGGPNRGPDATTTVPATTAPGGGAGGTTSGYNTVLPFAFGTLSALSYLIKNIRQLSELRQQSDTKGQKLSDKADLFDRALQIGNLDVPADHATLVAMYSIGWNVDQDFGAANDRLATCWSDLVGNASSLVLNLTAIATFSANHHSWITGFGADWTTLLNIFGSPASFAKKYVAEPIAKGVVGAQRARTDLFGLDPIQLMEENMFTNHMRLLQREAGPSESLLDSSGGGHNSNELDEIVVL